MKPAGKSTLNILLPRIVTAAIAVALGLYLYRIRADLVTGFQSLDPGTFALILITVIAQWSMRTTRDRLILKAHGYSLRWIDLFLINNLQLAANHLPLRAGTVLAAAVLKREHNVRLRHFASFYAAQQLLVLLPASVIAGLILATHQDANPTTQEAGLAVLCVLAATLVGVLLFPIRAINIFPEKISLMVEKVQQAVRETLGNARLLAPLLILMVGIFAASALRMYIIFKLVLGVNIDAGATLIIATMLHLSLLVSITPAGFGIREALVGFGALLLSMPAKSGVMASIIERAVVITAMLSVFAISRIAAAFGVRRSG